MKTLPERLGYYLRKHLPGYAVENKFAEGIMQNAENPFEALRASRVYGNATEEITGNLDRLYRTGKLPMYAYAPGKGRPVGSKNAPKRGAGAAEARRMRREIMALAEREERGERITAELLRRAVR